MTPLNAHGERILIALFPDLYRPTIPTLAPIQTRPVRLNPEKQENACGNRR